MSERAPAIPGGPLDDLAAEAARLAAPVYRAKQHEWRDVGIPDEAQIAASVRSLIHAASASDDTRTSSGGIHVDHFWEDGREHYEVRLDLARIEGKDNSHAQ